MGPPPFFFFFPMLFMLVFWAVPIYFVARWAIRVRRALEAKNTADLPTGEQFARLTDRLDSLAEDLDRLKERQDFVERLLQAPKAPAAAPAVPPGPAPAGPAGNPPAAPPGNSPPAPGVTGPI